MDLPGEAIISVASGFALLCGAAAWWIKRVGGRTERELKTMRAEQRQDTEDSEKACREREASMVTRITGLEERSHKEGREDRDRMLNIIAQHGEAQRSAATISAEGHRALASALSRVAERLPDPTPPRGNAQQR